MWCCGVVVVWFISIKIESRCEEAGLKRMDADLESRRQGTVCSWVKCRWSGIQVVVDNGIKVVVSGKGGERRMQSVKVASDYDAG